MRPRHIASGAFSFPEPAMRLVVTEADTVRSQFEAACRRLGDGEARRVFSMALNMEGRKALTAHRRALVKQSSIPRSDVHAAVRFTQATRSSLETRTTGSGRHLPLSRFGAKQFSYGVRAKLWGKAQMYPSAFVVRRYGNNVYKRTSAKRLPIEQLWGPAIPVEMLRDDAFEAWAAQSPKIAQEAQLLFALMLSGVAIGRQGTP
ncbi:MAG: hypothetical protein B7Y80_20725 [Hyphomicrobium sp. 32-62-53]|nr:MAG: hypothetical protein B7Y80_20725 [Hyphomicrobium sp. 32-62-53]